MKKLIGVIISILMVVCFSMETNGQIKQSDLSGKWYTNSQQELDAEITAYLANSKTPAVEGKIKAILVPHAGFIYSGPIAATAFKAVEDRKDLTVVLIGFTHRKNFFGASVLCAKGYETPLGVLEIDEELSRKIIDAHPSITDDNKAFDDENSIEMQVPFIQKSLVNPKAVIIAIGNQDMNICRSLSDTLANVLEGRNDVLLIGSTDMSHYLPYDEANRIDEITIRLLEKMNPEDLYLKSQAYGHHLLCGISAVCTTMLTAIKLGADSFELCQRKNSGDTSGDKSAVVGYFSALLTDTGKDKPQQTTGKNMKLDKDQQKRLLSIARQTIDTYLANDKKPDITETDPLLNEEMGLFVTLHKHGQLRGCIGNIIGHQPLWQGVVDMAIAASTQDPRFPVVSQAEMDDIDIEISVLTPPEKIDNPYEIQLGTHGVIVQSSYRSGVFLPQVATETGWSLEEFMDNLCAHKAGLEPQAWKTGECEILVFKAQVFGEKQ